MKFMEGVKVGVQSWCFHKFKDNKEVIKMLRECGLDTIELCDVHVDVYNDNEVDEVIRLYKENNITISSCGIWDFVNDEAKVRPVFEFAKKAGIPVIGVSPDKDAFFLLEKMCREYAIKIAIHNHGSSDDRYGLISQLEDALKSGSSNLGLCLDTGWMIEAGEDPLKVVSSFPDRIYGLHLKDFVSKPDGTFEETVLGSGDLNLEALVALLREIGYKGYATIEYEVGPENPVPGIKECVKNITSIL